jgi:glycosyltransferase involved in cell wall biosynthesis
MYVSNKKKVGYLAPEIPALSATFVYNEILEMQKMSNSIFISIASVHEPLSEVNEEVRSKLGNVKFLYNVSFIKRLKEFIVFAFKKPNRLYQALKYLIFDLKALGLNRTAIGQCYRFISAVNLSKFIDSNHVEHLHVHFAHVPTDLAMYACKMSGIDYSVTAHANDIFQRGYLLNQKIERSKFFGTISEYNRNYLSDFDEYNKLKIVRCGVDLNKFTPRAEQPYNKVQRIGVLGRLVEKKGIHILLNALPLLEVEDYIIEIIGDGPEKERLEVILSASGKQDKVKFLGKMPNEQVSNWLQKLDFFILPCVKDVNGDMDGIPVSLMEAMLKGVPVISTNISGVPELVIDGETGFLATTGDLSSLVQTIDIALNTSLEKRELISKQAIKHVKQHFSLRKNTEYLSELINE